MSVRTSIRFSLLLLPCLAIAACAKEKPSGELTRVVPKIRVVEPAPTVAAAPVQAPSAASPVSGPPEKPAKVAASKPAKAKGDGKRLEVKRLVLAKGVEKSTREPEGVASEFKKGEFEKIYAFLEVANPGDESEVLVSFDPPSTKAAKGNVRLGVGTSPRWRTWAFSKGLDEKGEWTAIVTAPDGRELAREKFTVL